MARSLTLTSPVQRYSQPGAALQFPSRPMWFLRGLWDWSMSETVRPGPWSLFPSSLGASLQEEEKVQYVLLNYEFYESGRERVVGRQGHSTDSCVLPHCIVTETIYVQTTEYPSQIYKHHKVLIEIIYGRALCTHSILSSTTCKNVNRNNHVCLWWKAFIFQSNNIYLQSS